MNKLNCWKCVLLLSSLLGLLIQSSKSTLCKYCKLKSHGIYRDFNLIKLMNSIPQN
jgi:hypothetical protein